MGKNQIIRNLRREVDHLERESADYRAQIPGALGISISGTDEKLATLELTNDEHLDALQIMIDQARLINADREGRGDEPVAINYVMAVVALLLGAADDDVIDMFAELYSELLERGLPVAPFMAEPAEPEYPEMTEEDLLRVAAYWSAHLDCRPGWMGETCHNLRTGEVSQLVELFHLAIAQAEL